MNYVGNETSVDALEELIDRDGYVIVERFAPELVAAAKAQLDAHIEATPFGTGNFHGKNAKDVEGLVGKSQAAHQLMLHDTVLALCDRILLPNCVRYQLSYTGIAVQYSLGWLRQEENLHLAVPPELAKTLPDRLARLVGYELGAPFCWGDIEPVPTPE